jgi:putative oxidoreductase
MANSDSVYSRWAPRVLSILRLVAGFLIMQHGLQKILGVPSAPAPGPGHEAFRWLSTTGISGILELVGGTLVLVGLFTRPAAFILSGMLAVAYFMVHAPGGFWPILNKGELAVIYCFVFLYLAAAGGGEWSLDRLLRRERPSYR